jgi:hypothetical protein
MHSACIQITVRNFVKQQSFSQSANQITVIHSASMCKTFQEPQNPEQSGKMVSTGMTLQANNLPEQTHDKVSSLQAEYS